MRLRARMGHDPQRHRYAAERLAKTNFKAVFIAVDYHDAECVGIHANQRGTHVEALEMLREGDVLRLCPR